MPRSALTRDAVVDAAIALVDDAGLEALTLAATAARVGVRLPSLYNHVAGVDDLRGAVAARATGLLAARIRDAAIGRAHSDALVAIADAYRDFARDHPGLYAATVRAPDVANLEHARAADDLMVVVNAVLAGYGLRGDDALDAARALRAMLHGWADLERSNAFGSDRPPAATYQRIISEFDRVLRAAVAGERKTL
ncbi:TetR/AcrR family transcriptional regulator [Salinibacterium sp. ZJ454]|uniref:TetR/AcrR family transcriptional regulator n=1 Tax=Salinibacterium sp. ZJ454 TaxID=2708339 RepID=UPI00141FFDC9|nr:TetR/AcrR family transcriptional regulator [Salinibacterium sp. ZJ454]